MRFQELSVPGVFAVLIEPVNDDRGFFARTWSAADFAAHGLNPNLVEISVSFNPQPGTLRGMHFQAAPHEEAKLVRCTRGAIFDVAVDVRPASSAFRHWAGLELTAENGQALYVPEGCAHGFITLVPDTEVLYQISHPHAPGSAGGVRWDDPEFDIEWPRQPAVMSQRDRDFPDFTR